MSREATLSPARRHLSFAQNSLLALVTQGVVGGLALVAVPAIVHTLGTERFGVLSVFLLLFAYVGFFDLGIGQATQTLLPPRMAAADKRAAGQLLASACLIGLALSALLMAVFGVLLGTDALSLFQYGNPVANEATACLQLFVLSIPAIVLAGVLKSVPLSVNRLDLSNALQMLSALLQWGGSLLVIYLGGGLVALVALLVAVRCLSALLLYSYSRRVLPLRCRGGAGPGEARALHRALLAYAGWASVAQAIGPLLLLMERMIVSQNASPAAVAYFAMPQDMLVKLVAIPMSLAATLYPLVSAHWKQLRDTPQRARLHRVYHDAVRYAAYALLPLVFIGMVFGDDLLRLWLGESFADHAGGVFVIVVLGMLFHGLAQIPNALILAAARPRIAAVLLMTELLPYLLLCGWLTARYGVRGAAVAWLLRVAAEAGYLFVQAHRLWAAPGGHSEHSYLWKGPLLVLACGFPLLALHGHYPGVTALGAACGGFLLLYLASLWWVIFDGADRARFADVLRPYRG